MKKIMHYNMCYWKLHSAVIALIRVCYLSLTFDYNVDYINIDHFP